MLLVLNLSLAYFVNHLPWLTALVGIASALFFAFVVSFFRIPPYTPKSGNGKSILAPADGKVVVIEETEETEYFKDKRIQVSIFMSPANVHVNRSPMAGSIEYLKYHPGDYLVAWHPKSSTENERFTTVIKNTQTEVELLVRQIAGKVARKISNYLDEGQAVQGGAEFGFIKFGSRVDLFLPLDVELKIELNQKVKGGKTTIAVVNQQDI